PPLATPSSPVLTKATTVELRHAATVTLAVDTPVRVRGQLDGSTVDAALTLPAGPHRFGAGTRLDLPAGAPVPAVSGVAAQHGLDWLLPGAHDDAQHGLFATYSLILATFLGTMGLPPLLVRFYTNPDGAAARRTTLVVLGLVGLFYLFPTLYGVLGRVYTPQRLMTGQT